MKKLLLTSAAVSLMGGTAFATVFDIEFSGGQMNGAQAGTASSATGTEFGNGITYDDVANALTFNFQYAGLGSAWSGTELRGPAAPGVTGSLISALATDQIDATSGYVSPLSPNSPQNAITLSETQEGQLLSGQLYVVINSVSNPNGEIRGQLTAVPEPQTYAMLGALGLMGFAGYRRFRSIRQTQAAWKK